MTGMALLLAGASALLIYSGVVGVNPVDVVGSALRGEPIPTAGSAAPPIGGGGGGGSGGGSF